MKNFLLLFCFFPLVVVSQQLYDFSDSAVENRIRKDLCVLANDSLKGREAGTENEIIARDYIINEFIKAGLAPFNTADSSYIQELTFSDHYWDYEKNTMAVDGNALKLWSDFYPLANVGVGFVYGEIRMLNYDSDSLQAFPDAKDRIVFLLNTLLHSPKVLLEDVVRSLEKDGAKAIVIVPASDFYSFYSVNMNVSIPVMIMDKACFDKISWMEDSEVKLQITPQSEHSFYNVIGVINNNASSSIVIGGHYDHEGIKRDAVTGEYKVYNGADDNASGTVAVMELARYLKQQGPKNYNYILCAFSGEEKGLLGSYGFVKSKTFDTTNVKFMLDFDMVGRLGAFGNVLYVAGVGSSKHWKKILRKNPSRDFKMKKVPDGMDGSDDYPFYRKGVPVLFFITGLHKDYHTPADDADKINFSGEVDIIKYARTLIEKIPPEAKLKHHEVTAWQTFRSYLYYVKMFF